VIEVAAFVVGIVLGSFANVLIHRLPRRESVVSPGSHCAQCGVPILPWDNLPVISYLLLRGRCRRCGAQISPRYLVVEVVVGLLFAGVAGRFGLSVEAGRFAAFALALVVVFFTDLEMGLIPNAVTYPGIGIGLVFAALSGTFVSAFVSAAGVGALFLLIAILSRGGMGGGDIKLATMIGAFLGAPGVIVAMFLAVALGALAGGVLMALRLRTRKHTIPFGPALAVGAMIAVFGSDAIVRWYLTRML